MSVLHLPNGAADDEAVHVELHSVEKRELQLKLGTGLQLTLRDDDPVLEISVDGGDPLLVVERDGAVMLRNLRMEADGTVKLESDGEVTIKGSRLNLN